MNSTVANTVVPVAASPANNIEITRESKQFTTVDIIDLNKYNVKFDSTNNLGLIVTSKNEDAC